MQFDWLTIAAQIANFLVLIWLLQRFLYAPITQAMAKREARIEQRLADARTQKAEAEQEAETLRKKQIELDQSVDTILANARQQAEDLKHQLEEKVRDEVQDKRLHWHEHLEEEKAELALQLRKRMAEQVLKVARLTLSEFTNADLADQLANEFARQIATLKDEDRKLLSEAASATGEQALVECGIDLPPAARSRISKAIHENLIDRINVTYRKAEDVLLGVRMTLGDRIVEWSAGGHLDKLDELVRDSLEMSGREAQASSS